jgi:hypothetical protein
MIIRLSQKLNRKIKAGNLEELPLHAIAYVDWSAHLFSADRTQYILLSNTRSLYSTAMYGKGIANHNHFINRALSSIREFMEDDGQAFTYQRMIVPACSSVRFAKALNRSVTGSMNDLILHATDWLTEGNLSPHDVGFKLNEIPFSTLEDSKGNRFCTPREVFRGMMSDASQPA